MAKAKKTAEADTAGQGHNSDALEVSLLLHMQALREGRAMVAEAQDALKAVKKKVKAVRQAAVQAGFTLKILDEALDVEEINDRQAESNARERRWVFETLGLPTGGQQGELFGEEADTVRDQAFWGNRGYNDGLKALPATAPPEMPTQFLQAYLTRHAAGAERMRWAAAAQVNVEKVTPVEDPLLN